METIFCLSLCFLLFFFVRRKFEGRQRGSEKEEEAIGRNKFIADEFFLLLQSFSFSSPGPSPGLEGPPNGLQKLSTPDRVGFFSPPRKNASILGEQIDGKKKKVLPVFKKKRREFCTYVISRVIYAR